MVTVGVAFRTVASADVFPTRLGLIVYVGLLHHRLVATPGRRSVLVLIAVLFDASDNLSLSPPMINLML